MDRQILGETTASYSLGVSVPAGRLVFISGTVAMDDDGQVVGLGDMETQSRYVFEQIGKLLQEAGATFDNVVKITTFVTDLTDYGKFSSVRQEVFGDGPYPASSTVKVAGLVVDGLLLEVEAIAVV